MSKVISRLFWFFLTKIYDWLAKFAPFSQPLESKAKPIVLGPTRFPALDTGYMYLLRVLIG